MASIWVVLLDISGSMREGFSGPITSDPLAERGPWQSKLEAAKDILIRQIHAARAQDIAVYTFADLAEKRFHGKREVFAQAEDAIRQIQAGGNTNLASAFTAVFTDPSIEGYHSLRVLVLSDGLSNEGDPVAAAEELIAKYPRSSIDTILIDDTTEGRAVAEHVSINGSVRPGFPSQLSMQIQDSRVTSLSREISGLAGRAFELQGELSSLTGGAPPSLITVTSGLELGASSLRNEIAPTLGAFEQFQAVVGHLGGASSNGKVTSISQSSPVSISLSGFREAIELALEWVIPWRREHARKLAECKARQAELQNQGEEIRLGRERIQLEKDRLENRRLELAIMEGKVTLAERMLKHLDPDGLTRGRKRELLLRRLLNGVDQLCEATIEFESQNDGPEPAPNQLTRLH